MRTQKEKMLASELYRADAPELLADNAAAIAWMQRYNVSIGLTAGGRYCSRQPGTCDPEIM